MRRLFEKTIAQVKAIRLLCTDAIHIMIYGGSRSGKTFIILFAIIVRACKCRSRHVILRHTFNSVKTSVWLDTLPKVLSICFPRLVVAYNKTDYYITFPNGSELWIAGLDDEKRVEKILGKEYSTIFFNECSQLTWSAVCIALTRLAEKSDLVNKAYYDENPPSKKHWSYWLFIRGIDPETNEPIDNLEDYASMMMNPKDNIDNIDENYIKKILDRMPLKKKKRFRDGEFIDGDDGEAYYAFDRDRHVSDKAVKPKNGGIIIGMDFNVHPMTAVILAPVNNKYLIFDEEFLENSDTYKMSDALIKKKYIGMVIPDSTGKNRKTSGKSDHAILKGNGFTIPYVFNPYVTDRVNNVNRLLTDNRIIIHPKCKKLIGDLEKVVWKNNELDQKGEAKMLTHISDALGYALWHLDPIKDGNITRSEITKYM